MKYVEELARALHATNDDSISPTWNGLDPRLRELYVAQSEAMLDAVAYLAERGGPKLLRRMSTPCMDSMAAGQVDSPEEAEACFAAMFDAAPAVPEEEA